MGGGHLKGRTYEEIHGEEKAKELKKIRSKNFSRIRKGKDPWNKDKKNIYSEESLNKMKINNSFTLKEYEINHPDFVKIEKPKIDKYNKIKVKCINCSQWFEPTYIQLRERLRCLKFKIRNNNSYFFCSNKCKNNSEIFNRKVTPHQQEKFKRYVALVQRYTRKTVLKHEDKILDIELRGKKNGYELDHKYSIYDGFINEVNPKAISHYKNLQVITSKSNRSKSCNSLISLQELLSY